MSFNHHGYTHLELAETPWGGWTWICESCGGDGTRGKNQMVIEPNSALELLIDAFHGHVADSHARTHADFEGWPNGL